MAQEDRVAAKEKANQVIEKLRAMKLAKAAEIVAGGIEETLSYYALPAEHWRCLRTNNPLERLMREIRRRTRVVDSLHRLTSSTTRMFTTSFPPAVQCRQTALVPAQPAIADRLFDGKRRLETAWTGGRWWLSMGL
jgi:hypothetical protein